VKLKILWTPALLLLQFYPAYSGEAVVKVPTAAATRPEIRVSTLTFAQTLEKLEKGALFVDNRPAFKFAAGHIPGALNMTYFEPGAEENSMEKSALLKAAGDREIVFYCTGYFRAYHAARQALAWGMPPEKIHWYRGGFTEWSRLYARKPGVKPAPKKKGGLKEKK